VFSSRFVRYTRLDRLHRSAGVSDRAVALGFVARFADEVLSGAWTVLTPTFRAVFRLSLVQIGFLSQLLNWVALVVEPLAAVHIDVGDRRLLMAGGALALAGSAVMMGLAPGYAVLALGFGLYGVGSGPLVLTADVLVVETFPGASERAYSRATFLDTLGALVGPGVVALAAAFGLSWRVVLVGLGGCVGVYALSLAGTRFPRPALSTPDGTGDADRESPDSPVGWAVHVARLVANGRTVVRDRRARTWLVVLLCFDLFEAAFVLKYIWLHDSVGLGQPLVAVYATVEQVVDLVALAMLDRWLARRDAGHILRYAASALVVLPTAWVVAPGIAGRIAVGIPLAFAYTLIWPLAKSQSLTAIPELGGATQAITALFPILPLALVEARVAAAVGVGPAMAATATLGALLMLLALRAIPPSLVKATG